MSLALFRSRKKKPMTAKRSDLVVPALVGVGLSAVVFVLSAIAKNHFGPLDGLCNGAAELEPHQSTGAVVSCGGYTWLYSMASFAYVAAIVVGVLSALVLVLGVVVSPETLNATGPQGGATKASDRPGVESHTLATGTKRSS